MVLLNLPPLGTLRLIAGALWFCVAAAAAGAAVPLDEQADGLTAEDVHEAGRAMWEPIVVGSYREAAAEAHEGVTELLAGISHRLTNARDAPRWSELERAARLLLDEGVDDPHVHGWYGHALAVDGDMAGAEPHARIAADALLPDPPADADDAADADAVPLLLQGVTAQRMGWIYSNLDQPDRAEAYRQRAAHLYVRALAEASPADPLQQRVIFKWVRDDSFDQLSHEDQQVFYDRCVDHGVDGWISDLLAGLVHLRKGRAITDEHGSGPLPLEVGIAYHRHMSDARRHLADAHEAEPDRPEPASWLITVAALGYAPGGTTARDWFDRAVAAQFDHVDAYSHMIDALHPHRVGSRDELLDFGRACLMTERFDTDVPYQFFRVLEKHVELLGGDHRGAFTRDGVPEKLLWMLERYRERPERQRERAWFDSFIAAVAWRAGRIRLAGEALTAAGPEVQERAFERLGAVPERAIGEIQARTGQFARITREIERRLDRGEHDVAIAELDALAERHRGRSPLRQFFQHLAAGARIERDLELGGEAALTPGADLAGWTPMVGQWSREEDGDLVGRSGERGLWIACDVPLGTSFELIAEVEFDLETANDQPNAGLFFGHRSGEGFHTFLAHHHNGSAQLNHGLWGGTEADAPVEGVSELRLIVRERRVYAFVNDRPVFSNETPRKLREDERARIGLGGHYADAGAVVRFRNIRAQRIDEQTIGRATEPRTPALKLPLHAGGDLPSRVSLRPALQALPGGPSMAPFSRAEGVRTAR